MEIDQIVLEFQDVASELNREFTNFKKDPVSRKTSVYKEKKLAKASSLYERVVVLKAEIARLLTEPNPCIELEIQNCEENYKRYFTELNALVVSSSSRSEKSNPSALHIQQQDVRFEAIRKIIEDINATRAAGVIPARAFCRLKLKTLQEGWTRIQRADEEFTEDRSTLPGTYFSKMIDFEEEVESGSLFLETELDQPTYSIGNPNQRNDDVKLPRVTIPKFQGDYFKWMSFRDLFCTMVKDKTTLSDGQKMQMLKTLVDGEAASLIADLTIADVNFNSAWTRLLERYDNNRVVVYKHLNKLITQSAAKNEAKSVKKVLDTTDQVLLALQNLGRPIASWDDWIIMTVTQKLSEESRKDWERKIGDSSNLPTWIQLKKFLGEQFRMLEGIENSHKKESQKPAEKPVIKSYQSTTSTKQCQACDGDHKMFNCSTFKSMNVKQRWELAKKKKLCFACLQVHDDKLKCDREKPCKKCSKRHSTWLHEDNDSNQRAGTVIVNAHGKIADTMDAPLTGLLATVLVLVQDNLGKLYYLRALLDSGSQASMITSRAAAMMGQPFRDTPVHINGLGGTNNGKTQIVYLRMKPRFQSNFSMQLGCFVLKKLTEPLPNRDIDISDWTHLQGLQLADPMFNKRGGIDLLLGADVLTDIMLPQIIKGSDNTPMAQETVLGWIVSGRYDAAQTREISCFTSTIDDDDENWDLAKFWEIEDLTPPRKLTCDEEDCEKYYDQTVTRSDDGRFIVKIPFKKDNNGPSRLGESRNQCMARFLYLERRLIKDEDLKDEYCKVMQEYIDMGHMVEVAPRDKKLFYIPHHAVVKPDSLTTKTRVVFDASAKTTTGVSLNDCMYVGAKQQDDLINILIKWRTFPVVFKADIAKMYRMIKIDQEDQQYHTILWRKDPKDQLKEYQLNTVTFGTAAAPFLATRTLVQIAKESEDTLPLASVGLRHGFYVDDLIYGCESIQHAVACKAELIQALEGAGMTLRKWSSNEDSFLQTIPENMSERSLQAFEEDAETKALGLHWNPNLDQFGFKINFAWDDKPLTKRKMLSEASKLFDPLGWCAPVILKAKLMMQDVWLSGIGWDQLVSTRINDDWTQLRGELYELSNLKITRWIGLNKNDEVQLHGFSDASEKAYSAVIYTRIVKDGDVYIRIIAAKTRVAPIKSKITLPRMELCGTVLLAQLMTTVKQALQIDDLKMFAWCDSTVTLAWLQGEPARWKTFVANRISEVQASPVRNWRYCPTEDNPADCASRGIMPIELMQHQLWWTGPKWLKESEDNWPDLKIEETMSEQKSIIVNLARVERNELLLGASSWFRVVRALAYCRRMKHRELIGTPLSAIELKSVSTILIQQCQQEEFPDEMNALMRKNEISSKSNLLALNPFLDENGIMRVGGRLQNAMLTYDNKHPVILPRKHAVTQLIVEQMHKDTLHGGPQLMLTVLRKKYWILHGKRAVNDMYKKCLACKRFKATTVQQMMGDLPEPRVTLERAFLHTGVDYCGPIEVRSSKLRGSRLQKGYIAIFVCLGTRASHLELVSDCTTAAFLAAFDRFIARRGICDTMYSDNGTNFVGAYNVLAKQEKEWLHSKNMEIANAVSNKGINWKFIPPGAPNFGGIWERNVRAVKDHLKRTLKTTRLTFEEYGTILCQIEACLNSRPIQALTADVENINALTPGHFLIGDALMAPPQSCLPDTNANRNNRWKHLQLLQQHFWNRWSCEYLNQLQQRQKWKKGTQTVKIGDLVLVKDEQLPPKNWLLGRIEETHPGSDGRVRVVTLRTHNGQIKRPMNKICQLLTNEELEEGDPETNQDEPIIDTVEEEHEIEEHDLGPDVRQCEPEKPIQKVKLIKPVDQARTQAEPRYNLRPKNTPMILAIVIGLMLLLGGGSASETKDMVKIAPFQNNAGIYFEELGRAQTVRTQWNIFIRFDLQRYRQDVKKLRMIEQTLTDLCVDLESRSSRGTCEDTTGLIHHQLKIIEDLNSILESNGDEASFKMRKRRATPLSAVGWIQHELFGVMSSEQAESIDQHFKEVEQNGLYTIQLLKNQTSIVDSTVNLMKTTQEEINKNYEKIETQISQLKNETNMVKRRLKIVALSLYTLAFVNRVGQIQENILDMTTDLHQGHVSSHVFNPQQFKEQLEIMRNNLPSDSIVPEIAHHDIKALYKIIRGSARVTHEYIVLVIEFPLVSRNEFQLWHVIPIPTVHEENQITLVPEAEYLMINLQRNNFYTPNRQEIHTCLRPKETMFICNMRHPLYTAKSTVSLCERDLLNNQMELNPSCKMKLTPKKEFWISLTAKNKWIFGTIKPKTLNVVCRTITQQILVNASGILELMPGCEINQPGMTLIAESIKQTNGNFNYYPLVNLSDAVTRAGQQNTSSGIKLMNLTLDHAEQLDQLSTQLRQLDQQTHTHYAYHLWHSGGHMGLMILLVTIVIIIWFSRDKILNLISQWITRKTTPTTNQDKGDVELKEVTSVNSSDGSSDIHHSSDDSQLANGTFNGHKGGRCPFRT